MGPTWDPPGSCRPQMVPMLALWTLLSGHIPLTTCSLLYYSVKHRQHLWIFCRWFQDWFLDDIPYVASFIEYIHVVLDSIHSIYTYTENVKYIFITKNVPFFEWYICQLFWDTFEMACIVQVRVCKISNIRRTKFQNVNVSRLGLQLSLRNILKSCAEWRMKI